MSENVKPASTEKVKPINRLKSFYPFRQLEQDSYIEALEASKEGLPVAWSVASSWQADVPLRAMGIPVVYPENYASICAARGIAERYLELSDGEGYPTNLCGYSRCTIGYAAYMKEHGGEIPPDAPFGGIPKPTLLATSGFKCDCRFKWFQALSKYYNAARYCVEMPMMGAFEGTEADLEKYQVKYMVTVMKEYIAFLEELLGKKMDYDKLDELIGLMGQMHVLDEKTTELCKAAPGPRHSVDFWGSFSPSLFTTPRMNLALQFYQDMFEEVKERVANKVSSINYPEKYRIIFADLPPWHSMKFFDSLAERGWNFVYESYSYHQRTPPDFTGINDPVEKLVRLGRRTEFGSLDLAKKGGVANYAVALHLKAAQEYKADGFFIHPLASCRPVSQHLRTLQDLLQTRLDVPSLWVEGDMMDRSVFNPQEVLSRADAFEQAMEHYRKVRRSKGLDW